MLQVASENFKEGKITRQALASWMVEKFHQKYFTRHLDELRAAHKDPIRVLQNQIAELRAAKQRFGFVVS